MGEIGAFGPFIPEKYGGAGMDHISYGVIMTELGKRRFGCSKCCFSTNFLGNVSDF